MGAWKGTASVVNWLMLTMFLFVAPILQVVYLMGADLKQVKHQHTGTEPGSADLQQRPGFGFAFIHKIENGKAGNKVGGIDQ